MNYFLIWLILQADKVTSLFNFIFYASLFVCISIFVYYNIIVGLETDTKLAETKVNTFKKFFKISIFLLGFSLFTTCSLPSTKNLAIIAIAGNPKTEKLILNAVDGVVDVAKDIKEGAKDLGSALKNRLKEEVKK